MAKHYTLTYGTFIEEKMLCLPFSLILAHVPIENACLYVSASTVILQIIRIMRLLNLLALFNFFFFTSND